MLGDRGWCGAEPSGDLDGWKGCAFGEFPQDGPADGAADGWEDQINGELPRGRWGGIRGVHDYIGDGLGVSDGGPGGMVSPAWGMGSPVGKMDSPSGGMHPPSCSRNDTSVLRHQDSGTLIDFSWTRKKVSCSRKGRQCYLSKCSWIRSNDSGSGKKFSGKANNVSGGMQFPKRHRRSDLGNIEPCRPGMGAERGVPQAIVLGLLRGLSRKKLCLTRWVRGSWAAPDAMVLASVSLTSAAATRACRGAPFHSVQ